MGPHSEQTVDSAGMPEAVGDTLMGVDTIAVPAVRTAAVPVVMEGLGCTVDKEAAAFLSISQSSNRGWIDVPEHRCSVHFAGDTSKRKRVGLSSLV